METKYKIAIGVGAVIVILLVIGLIALLVWHFWPSLTSSSSRLNTPEGEMTAVAGPYNAENAITGTSTSGHITEDRYPAKNLYAKYGYRAVYVKDGEVVDRSKSSKILWNDLIYKVMTYNTDQRENSGFKFKIPKQNANLIADDIEYELVSTIYDNMHKSGTPLYKELTVGRVASTETVLEITESDDKTENKILIS